MSIRTSKYADINKFRESRNRYKANRLLKENLSAKRKRMPYTEKEIMLVLSKSKTDKEIAKELGRSTSAICISRQRFIKKGYTYDKG